MESTCKYCLQEADSEDCLICNECSFIIHTKCVKTVPENGFLVGDVFFDFVCFHCDPNLSRKETLTRRKLPWIMVVIITLHNLSKFSVSCQNHFHFRSHITNFVERNWDKFFPNVPKRKKKNLLGTIAGILSQHSPETFSSGTEVIGSIGWWKLTKNWTPKKYDEYLQNKPKRRITNDNEDPEPEVHVKRIKAENAESCKAEPDLDFLLNVDLEDFEGMTSDKEPEDLIGSSSVKHELMTNESTSSFLVASELNPESDDAIYDKLKIILQAQGVDAPPWIRRYYRKLEINMRKRKTKSKSSKNESKDSQLLGKFYRAASFAQLSLLASLSSSLHFQSAYTGNLLHPFIYRHKKIFPRWLQLMCELKHRLHGQAPDRSTIDFCYLSVHHISAVNSLLQETFWPGIDMSDALSYPDFTIVALYKKLVIGCAFLIPDACHNEAYISFLSVRPCWDRSGIASFMLYHLTQTSQGKDITLHVSASNPAICLYQKFGFKTEELVLNFYEKYLPKYSSHSPHALFLRLTR